MNIKSAREKDSDEVESRIGLIIRCKKCGHEFPYEEMELNQELRALLCHDCTRKTFWEGAE